MAEEDAETVRRLQEEIKNLSVGEHLLYMMQSLSALAIERMGLASETALRRDLEQARLAIDAFKALVEVVEPVRPAGETAAHRGMLSQLQLAYVGVLSGGDAGGETDGDSAGAAAGDSAGTGESRDTLVSEGDE